MQRSWHRALTILVLVLIPHVGSALEIAVIGAGLSGLTTAYRLQQSQIEQDGEHNVQVYEARGRVGGRVLSAVINGSVEELGGQNFADGGDANDIIALTHEMGLHVDEYQSCMSSYFFDEQASRLYNMNSDPQASLPSQIDVELAMLEPLADQAGNLAQVLDVIFSEHPLQRRVFEARMRSYEGLETHLLSPNYATGSFQWLFESAHESMMNHRTHTPSYYTLKTIDGGNGLLPLALAASLGDNIHLNMPLTKVEKREGRFVLSFESAQVAADIVIVTVPTTVLDDIEFGEGVIPILRLNQIKTLPTGKIAKILVPIQNDHEYFGSVVSEHMLSWFGKNGRVATFYYAGAKAIAPNVERLSEMFSRDVQAVKTAFPHLEVETQRDVQKNLDHQFASYTSNVGCSWASEPYTKGGYSAFSPESYDITHQTSDYRGHKVLALFAPVGDEIFFAGEHTDLENPATMQGAVKSGERAAAMVLESLKDQARE